MQKIFLEQMLDTNSEETDDSFLHHYLSNLVEMANENAASDMDSEESLEVLLAQEDGSVLFEQLEQTLENTLNQYYIPEEMSSEQQEQRLYILSVLQSIQKWEGFYPIDDLQNNAVMLWEMGNPLSEVSKDENLKVNITHPTSELYTLPIWKDPKADEKELWVADDSHLQHFRSSHLENIIYLPNLLGKDLIEFRLGEQFDRVRYKAIPISEVPFELPPSFYCQQNSLVGTFFKEQKDLDEGQNPYTVYINALREEKEVFRPEGEVGWLNPLIVTFDIAQDDIQEGYSEEVSRAECLVKLLTEQVSLLAVELHVDPVDDLRLLLLRKFIEKQQVENRDLNLLEYLMWGSQVNESITNKGANRSASGESFYVLDRLGGSFFVDDHGVYHKEIDPETKERLKCSPSIAWQAPKDLTLNAIWLKNHFLKSWILEDEDSKGSYKIESVAETPNYILPPFLRLINQTSRGTRQFKLKDSSSLPILRVLNSHPLVDLSDSNSNGNETSVASLYEFVTLVLKELGKGSKDYRKHGTYYGEGSFAYKGNDEVELDEIKLLESFSRYYLTPLSPVYVAIPDIEQGGPVYIDIVDSVQYGNKEFLRRLYLVNSINNLSKGYDGFGQEDFDQEHIKIKYKYAWWQDWFKTLFANRWDVKINFVPQHSGFIINSSLLGRTGLGLEKIGQRYNAREMRI